MSDFFPCWLSLIWLCIHCLVCVQWVPCYSSVQSRLHSSCTLGTGITYLTITVYSLGGDNHQAAEERIEAAAF